MSVESSVTKLRVTSTHTIEIKLKAKCVFAFYNGLASTPGVPKLGYMYLQRYISIFQGLKKGLSGRENLFLVFTDFGWKNRTLWT